MKIKKNDQVLIISGNDKGKKGKVLKAFPKLGKVVVEGVAIAKKHVKTKKSGQSKKAANYYLLTKRMTKKTKRILSLLLSVKKLSEKVLI